MIWRAWRGRSDDADLAEGLYIKAEAEGRVVGRYKFVRASFLQADANSDWRARPLLPNQLRAGDDIFGTGP